MTASESFNRTTKALRIADAWIHYTAPTPGVRANPADVYRAAANASAIQWRDAATLAGTSNPSQETIDAVLAILAHAAPHRTSVRSGRRDRGESNYVVECTCRRVIQVATTEPGFAARRATEHEVLNDPTDPGYALAVMTDTVSS